MNQDYLFNYQSHTEELVEEEVLLDTLKDEHDLYVINDEVNTFEYVIETLKKVCGHTSEQAEQCTYIIHFKGLCSVKKGSFRTLKPMMEAICERGIHAEIV